MSERLQRLRVGDPAQLATDVGPVISSGSQARCLRHIELAQPPAGTGLVATVTLPFNAARAEGRTAA